MTIVAGKTKISMFETTARLITWVRTQSGMREQVMSLLVQYKVPAYMGEFRTSHEILDQLLQMAKPGVLIGSLIMQAPQRTLALAVLSMRQHTLMHVSSKALGSVLSQVGSEVLGEKLGKAPGRMAEVVGCGTLHVAAYVLGQLTVGDLRGVSAGVLTCVLVEALFVECKERQEGRRVPAAMTYGLGAAAAAAATRETWKGSLSLPLALLAGPDESGREDCRLLAGSSKADMEELSVAMGKKGRGGGGGGGGGGGFNLGSGTGIGIGTGGPMRRRSQSRQVQKTLPYSTAST